MSFGRNRPSAKVTVYDDGRSYLSGSNGSYDYNWPKFANINDPRLRNYNFPYEFTAESRRQPSNNLGNSNPIAVPSFAESRHQYSDTFGNSISIMAASFAESRHQYSDTFGNSNPIAAPSLKRRRVTSSSWEACGSSYQTYAAKDWSAPSFPVVSHAQTERANANTFTTTSKRDRSKLEEEDVVFMSRDEIEGRSPSRKDGIDAVQEKQLRYSYCAFIQNLGLRLNLPQSTVGTAMVLCHRFFVRRSHACHDRFLISTASLFLAAKSEETARPLNNVLRVSCEILHKQDLSILSYMLPAGWFEQYRERVLDAENLILTTLNFELNVKHPYAPLTAVLGKLGLAQSDMVKLALNLVSEGLQICWCQNFPGDANFGFV
uniref:Cyclin-like domain-containing protein n=1 Tax=Kalanchoe fedtschenkoi TaxID=63787 RepID=A0A7N0V965_KALFE